jgi:2-oxo-3-hexenedioate decarboxylase
MTLPHDILAHFDSGRLWPAPLSDDPTLDLAQAYQRALQVTALRKARGEVPKGYKVGFTNRTIWPRYNVFAPIWGTVWDTTLLFCEGDGEVSLNATCQPRLEPEIVFGMKATPAPDATLQDLFDAIAWVAPGFEVVQSHLPDWKFHPTDTVADGALHARLLVGRRSDIGALAADALALDALLAKASVKLSRDGNAMETGVGSNVLDSPLRALLHFLQTLRACPGATDLQPGDVVTTGTWTDAWPIAAGQTWTAEFSLPSLVLAAHFKT